MELFYNILCTRVEETEQEVKTEKYWLLTFEREFPKFKKII